MSKGSEAVLNWRRRAKQKLLDGFGRQCGICGYSKCINALVLHHLDPATKLFSVGDRGIPRAWKRVVAEAHKCVMLCHNCHHEVHDGATVIPDGIRRFVEPEPMPMRRLLIKKNSAARKWKAKKVPNRPTGKSLRGMVQRTSRVAVAKKYGVSETAVRKWLKSDSKNGIY